MMDFTCNQCGAVYHTDPTHVGKRVRCTCCGCLVLITDGKNARMVSVEAEPFQVNKRSVAKPPAKSATNLRSRWPLYAGAFVIILAALSVWTFWYTNRKTEAKPYQSSDQARPIANEDSPRQRDIFDEVGDEQANSNAHNGRAAPPQLQDEAPKPDPRPTHYNSLPTGTRISDDVGTNGHGELTISNRTDSDAVVRLYESSSLETTRWFFVQSYSSCSVKAIPEGIYTLVYTLGLDWIESEDSFRWHPSYHEFERSLKYSELNGADRVQYHEISVTLHPVKGGNVRTKQISREEFTKGHRHMPLQKSPSQPVF